MKNFIGGLAVGVAVGLGIGAAIASSSAVPPVDEVATRGVTLGKSQRAYCERYCTAAIPGTPRHITVEIGRGGGTAVPEGLE